MRTVHRIRIEIITTTAVIITIIRYVITQTRSLLNNGLVAESVHGNHLIMLEQIFLMQAAPLIWQHYGGSVS